jgi:hypothetical protein
MGSDGTVARPVVAWLDQGWRSLCQGISRVKVTATLGVTMAHTRRNAVAAVVIAVGAVLAGSLPASADENSRVSSPDTDGAHLRPCPAAAPNEGASDCQGSIDYLPNGSPIAMLCWQDGSRPYGDSSSPRWLWGRELDGSPRPGTEGWMWAPLVENQADTPRCTTEESEYYQRQATLVLLEQGPAVDGGYRYAVTLSNMGADRDVNITCHDSVDPDGFYSFTMRTDSAGAAVAADQCWSGDSGDHWVTADHGLLMSNSVTW